MRLCIVSGKECWRGGDGEWCSGGGFPLQMAAIDRLFSETCLLVPEVARRPGGIALPPSMSVAPIRRPPGRGYRRKLSVVGLLPSYLRMFHSHFRSADVIHVPLPGDLPLLAMVTAAWMKKPLIARYGGSWASTSETTHMNRLTRLLMRSLAGGRNVMLATGDASAPPAPRMHWIFASALGEEELAGIRPVQDRGLSDPPRLCYVGRLSPEKGIANLLRALGALRDRGCQPLPILTLAGDGPQRRTLEDLASGVGCSQTVRFAGQLNRRELSAVLVSSDFCVQPSLTEGYSKAWLDAMAHGLPVLASDVGAAGAVVGRRGERGWLVPPGDVDSLRCVLTDLLGGTVDWPAMRVRCRAFVEGRTLEAWGRCIAEMSSAQWGGAVVDGKVHAKWLWA